jgi:hypothetical protein
MLIRCAPEVFLMAMEAFLHVAGGSQAPRYRRFDLAERGLNAFMLQCSDFLRLKKD